MGFLGLSRERSRLASWRKELERSPRPHGLAELARRYLALGESEDADAVLRMGESLFPTSNEIRRVRSMILADASEDRLRDAKERARSKPSVETLLELADSYRSVGRMEQCAASLRELIDGFGENPRALAELAEIRFARYRDSLAATDGRATADLLRRAIEADATVAAPYALMAELYALIGCVAFAIQNAEMAIEHDGQDERMNELREDLLADGGADRYEDVDSQLTLVEDSREFVRRLPWESENAEAEDDRTPLAAPDEELTRLRENGLARVSLSADGTSFGDGPGHEELREPGLAISKVFARAARGMELGSPSGVIVECENGALLMEFKNGASLALTTEGTARLERVAMQARDSLERVVRS